MKKKLLFCMLLCLLCLAGCGKKELLKEKLDANAIDKVVVTLAMGNPAYGADCKIITDKGEIEKLVAVFNGAVVEEKLDPGEEWVASSGSYTFFSGGEQILKLNTNGNDPEHIWINDGFYEIDYPDRMYDPYQQYCFSSAQTIVVDEDGKEMARPEA
ncbi:hypothetical protein [Anaerotignum sp.]